MQPDNYYRFIPIPDTESDVSYRTEFSRDYARILHSPSFRRLESKTQLFPGQESDFFRNRLTHSLEVAQIAKSLAQRLKAMYPSLEVYPEVCEIAGLMHDVGHPPFGHNGERALDRCMIESGGFEGNAQTIRIITRLEKRECPDCIISTRKKDKRVGLNLTARVIASALKYDNEIPVYRKKDAALVKGYYSSEEEVIKKVKSCLVGDYDADDFKTIECSIMDLADDIAYSTYDLEDAFKGEFLSPYSVIAADDSILQQIVEKLKKDNIEITVAECRIELIKLFEFLWSGTLFTKQESPARTDVADLDILLDYVQLYQYSTALAQNGYLRNSFTSGLVNQFINGVELEINSEHPILSRAYFNDATLRRVNILKHFAYVTLINSSRFKVAENRGQEIVSRMFRHLSDPNGIVFLPADFQALYRIMPDDLSKSRVICDFISGMTDRYALEFYERLFSENPHSIFKPLC